MGGSFDPVHIGHLILAEYALVNFALSKIIFVPNHLPPHKEAAVANSQERYNMLKLAIMDNPRFEVSELELKRKGVSYTYDTLLELKRELPGAKLYFILGADAYSELETWKNYPELIKLTEFIVASRPGTKLKKLAGVKVHKLSMPEIEISSSYLRERAKAKLSFRYLVPERVRDYILNYKLYR